MNNRPGNIFKEGPCLTAEELLAYAEGRLSGAEAHRAEKHLMECEFCAEALEGLADPGIAGRVPQLVDELNERIDTAAGSRSPARPAAFYYRRIAAVAALLIVAGGIWIYIGRMNSNEKLFSQYYEPYQQHSDSVAAQPAAGVVIPSQSTPDEKERQEQKVRSTKSYGNIAEKKALKEEKPVEVESTKDLTTADQTSAGATVVTPNDETTIQTNASKSMKLDETVSHIENTSQANEKAAPARTKNAEAVSKEAPTAAYSAKRETEYADVQVDATQLQRALLSEAIQFYAAGDYDQAFQKAEKFLKKFPKDPEGLFYSGVSALSLKKEKVAAGRLEDCLATGAQQWKEDASWYLSLCYVKLGKSHDAKPLLEFLAAGNGPHAAEANKMLESIH